MLLSEGGNRSHFSSYQQLANYGKSGACSFAKLRQNELSANRAFIHLCLGTFHLSAILPSGISFSCQPAKEWGLPRPTVGMISVFVFPAANTVPGN